MKKFILIALLAVFTLTPGCSVLSPKSPATWEASRFLSFKDTWATTLALYDYSKDRQVAGKLSHQDAADIDAAFNLFRLAFKSALAAANGDDKAFTPENVRKLGNDVLTLIYASQ